MATKVMLSLRQCQNLMKILPLRQRIVNPAQCEVSSGKGLRWRLYSTAVADEKDTVEEVTEEDLERQQEIDAKCDISRLPYRMKCRLEHSLESPGLHEDNTNPRQNSRKLYSYYGNASGIDPNVGWPTRQELEEDIEFEQEFVPSLQERWATLHAKKESELAERQAKEAQVKKQMARMPEYIAQFRKKLAKADEAEKKQEDKRTALMEEARDYFGFHIDPRDPRFKIMQEEKYEREQKMKKQKKKEEKGIRVAANLQKLQQEAKQAKDKETESK